MGAETCAIFVDMGTTNTRAWLVRGSELLKRATRPVGVRNTARDKSADGIKSALKEVISELRANTARQPECVVAAGMITSPLGLAELPHIDAPAGRDEIASAAKWLEFPELTELPFLLIPGVRCSPNRNSRDVMRGEETLCVGLTALRKTVFPCVLLNLGSHWKAIEIDGERRIHASTTSLAGELIQATLTQTVLASSLAGAWPEQVSHDWLEAGINECRRNGLTRTLFGVRLRELDGEGSPADRFSFVVGAFIADSLIAFTATGIITEKARVVINGSPQLSEAWQRVLARLKIPAVILDRTEAERTFLIGMNSILECAD